MPKFYEPVFSDVARFMWLSTNLQSAVKKSREHFACRPLRLRRCAKAYRQRVCALKEMSLGRAHFRALKTKRYPA